MQTKTMQRSAPVTVVGVGENTQRPPTVPGGDVQPFATTPMVGQGDKFPSGKPQDRQPVTLMTSPMLGFLDQGRPNKRVAKSKTIAGTCKRPCKRTRKHIQVFRAALP